MISEGSCDTEYWNTW